MYLYNHLNLNFNCILELNLIKIISHKKKLFLKSDIKINLYFNYFEFLV